jgi:hypothetical protein
MGIKLPYRKKKEGGGGYKNTLFSKSASRKHSETDPDLLQGDGDEALQFFLFIFGGGYEKKMQCTLFVSISISMHELSLNFNS